MDAGLVGVLVAVVAVIVVLLLARPKETAPLSEMLDALDRIEADPESTAVQKRATSEAVYESFRKQTVSIVGRVADVFPNGSAIIETPLGHVPFLGFDFERIKAAQLHALTKGHSMTLRATLDTWDRFRNSGSVVEVLRDARVFCNRRWYAVKNLYHAGASRLAPQTTGEPA